MFLVFKLLATSTTKIPTADGRTFFEKVSLYRVFQCSGNHVFSRKISKVGFLDTTSQQN